MAPLKAFLMHVSAPVPLAGPLVTTTAVTLPAGPNVTATEESPVETLHARLRRALLAEDRAADVARVGLLGEVGVRRRDGLLARVVLADAEDVVEAAAARLVNRIDGGGGGLGAAARCRRGRPCWAERCPCLREPRRSPPSWGRSWRRLRRRARRQPRAPDRPAAARRWPWRSPRWGSPSRPSSRPRRSPRAWRPHDAVSSDFLPPENAITPTPMAAAAARPRPMKRAPPFLSAGLPGLAAALIAAAPVVEGAAETGVPETSATGAVETRLGAAEARWMAPMSITLSSGLPAAAAAATPPSASLLDSPPPIIARRSIRPESSALAAPSISPRPPGAGAASELRVRPARAPRSFFFGASSSDIDSSMPRTSCALLTRDCALVSAVAPIEGASQSPPWWSAAWAA